MSNDFILSCCSTADLSKETYDHYNIHYVCFHYIINDEQHLDDPCHPELLSDFYQAISEGAQPTTAQVNINEFIEYFEPFLSNGKDILHISFSSGLSGAFNSACAARDQLLEKYPDRKIIIIDSLGASSGYGLLVVTAAEKKLAGTSIDDVAEYVNSVRLNIHHWFFSTDLSSYIRGGRVSKVAGFVGQALGICPLLNMDQEGHLIPREKIRTKKKAKSAIIEKMIELCDDASNYSGKCFMSHSMMSEDSQDIAKAIEERFPSLEGPVQIFPIGTTIGSHTGPGTIALFFLGKSRTE